MCAALCPSDDGKGAGNSEKGEVLVVEGGGARNDNGNGAVEYLQVQERVCELIKAVEMSVE
eukprot:4733958-Amphidinium_carterae.1